MIEVKSLRILVAEDNEANLFFLKTILGGSGYEVTGASNGKIALDKFNESDFDLILLDLYLPNYNGCQLLKIIRDREAKTKKKYIVFAVTGSDKITNQKDCEFVNFDEWLFKPFNKEDLIKLIHKYFSPSK